MTIGYDIADRRTSLTLPNGIGVTYVYDAASRVTGITYKKGTTTLGNLTYAYDAAGNRIRIGGSWARTGLPQAVTSASYNAANQQLALGNKTITYDQNGNLLTLVDPSGTTTFTWNARDQLVGMAGPGVAASFQYDAIGRREVKTVNGARTEFLYDGVNPVQETSGATVLANILGGLGVDEYFTRTDAGGTRTFLADALGSTVTLTDSAGAVQTQYTYEPFGKATVTGAASANTLQYTGRENDGTGLHYYRARYYHPGLQRFISADPRDFSGGDVNLYAYVFNKPIEFVDPTGEVAIAGVLPFFPEIVVGLAAIATAANAILQNKPPGGLPPDIDLPKPPGVSPGTDIPEGDRGQLPPPLPTPNPPEDSGGGGRGRGKGRPGRY